MPSWSRPACGPLRAEQAQRTRATVLDAAGRCFLEKGFAATTMKDDDEGRR
jgi:AcrR family transcriptional regulator